MKKQIISYVQGERADIGEIVINRVLPNRYANKVGPFVFLDHVLPVVKKEVMRANEGKAHPHRGIATLTYVLQGEAEHFDSRGNRATIYSGGAQWMKAANGIIHDETLNVDSKTKSPYIHGFQFWINLPAKTKKEEPEYMAVQASEIPYQELTEDSGWIKVVAGAYGNMVSKIPSYSEQFLFHVNLKAGKQFVLQTEEKLEYAAFLLQSGASINETRFNAGDFIKFDKDRGTIEIFNTSQSAIDIILFGGAEYTEPVVARGPFVMNTEQEIAEAYHDFHAGKYGNVVY
ncbi:pirin family protein [Pedobacter hiemivivus]|uniref:Pirin family protein n=1 Tax=Pedobacter hiemivivus TaxID=2530454 RepID=A0A4U1G675_9SPHI|nr:pirin family protein [Pedobacter hiemivivus]TKC59118.1 pirin family protein [Pedobacter hiemivivus]